MTFTLLFPWLQQVPPVDPWTLIDRYGVGIFFLYLIYKEVVPVLQNWLIPERKARLQAKAAEDAEERKWRRQREEQEWARKCASEDKLALVLDKLNLNLDRQHDLLSKMDTGVVLVGERMVEATLDLGICRDGINRLLDRNAKVDRKEKTVPRKDVAGHVGQD